MKSIFILPFIAFAFCILFLITCTDMTTPEVPSTVKAFAFINKKPTLNPMMTDSANFVQRDTVLSGDSLQLVGFAVPQDIRIANEQWDFGDNQNDSGSLATHVYSNAGVCRAIFSVGDRFKNIVSDTVFISVNTPPDSIQLLSPFNGATNVPLSPTLQWKGYDRDNRGNFDTVLVYSVILLRDKKSADTVVKWTPITSFKIDSGLTRSESISWFVLAKDVFGVIIASDTAKFSTLQNDDATLSNLKPLSGKLSPAFSPNDTIYTDTVPNTSSTVTLIVVPNDKNASITINNQLVFPPDSTMSLSLESGATIAKVQVLAENKIAKKTYCISFIRKPDTTSALAFPPTGVTAVGTSTSSIHVSWNEMAGAASYTIQQSAQLTGGFLKIGVSNSNTFIDTGLDSGTTRYYRVCATNSKGSTDYSIAAGAASFIKPSIKNQPQPQGVLPGTKAVFSIIASGVPAPSYQWRKNGMDIAPATAATCTTATITFGDNNAKYSCIINNALGKDTSAEATLRVDTLFTKPSIISQSHDTTVVCGADLTMSIKDSGSYLNIQWRKNLVVIAQAISCTLSLHEVKVTDAGTYTVKVWNASDSIISLPFKIKVLPKTPSAPSPNPKSAFSIGVSWTQADGASLYRVLRASGTGIFACICTTTQISIIDTPLTEGGTYAYRLIAANNDGESDTSAKAIAATFQGPNISKGPQAQKIIVGQTISLSVEATGNPTCTYQWKKNGSDIPGATSSTFLVLNAAAGDSGDYLVSVNNTVRTVNSNSVHVSVLPIFTLATVCSPPVGGSVTKGKDTTTYILGDTIRLKAHTAAGYRFNGWTGDTTASDSSLNIIIRKNRTVTANFVRCYTLSLSSPGNGSVSPTGIVTADSGASITIAATPNTGYKFSVWRVASGQAIFGDSTKTNTTVKLTQGNTSIQGIFTIVTFRKIINGSSMLSVRSCQQTNDGGYLVAGRIVSGRGDDSLYLTKLNFQGDSMWMQKYGYIFLSDFDGAVRQTNDGGFIITGQTTGYYPGLHGAAYLIKTDANGNQLWDRTFGDTSTYPYSYGYSIQQASDGGFIIIGQEALIGTGNVYLIKTDANGNKLWSNTFGSTNDCSGNSVLQTSDGGFIIAGYIQSSGAESDVYLIKTGPTGNTMWTKTFGGNDTDVANSVQPTSDGGYIIIGNTKSFGLGGSDIYLIKTDASGNQSWAKTFGSGNDDFGNSVRQTSDGGFIIAGTASTSGAGYFIKTNASGTQLWARTYGKSTISAQQTADGGYILISSEDSGTYLIKTDENGNVQ
jgi:uncharacterized repeat protein (TIGR02543 family)